jgi:molecular chaperone GrpE (heat shock protein)
MHETAAGGKLHGERAFQAFLREKMFQTITSRLLRQEDTLFYRYAKVRSLSATTAVNSGSSALEEELRLEVTELRKQLDEERGEKDYVYNYSAELEETVQRVEKERFSLRAQLEI